MQAAYYTTTTVLPGNRIEITGPELPEGQEVQVIVVPRPHRSTYSRRGLYGPGDR